MKIISIVLASCLLALVGCHRSEEPAFRPENTTPTPVQAPERREAEPVRPAAATEAPPAAPAVAEPVTAPASPALLNPAAATEQAPARYSVSLATTKGEVIIDVTRAWAPKGADRFYNLVKLGYLNDVAFFRVISGFMAQVGIHGDPAVNAAWRVAKIDDDAPTQSNTRGMVSFATSGPDSRTTQFFVNFGDNANLDGMGFAPFGKVRDMAPVDALYSGYGEGAPSGAGPMQMRVQTEGNRYLRAEFPQLDYIRTATIKR